MNFYKLRDKFYHWFSTSKIHYTIYIIVFTLALIFYLIALLSENFTHEIFTSLFTNFIAIFFTLFIVDGLLKIPQKGLRERYKFEFEKMNFNFIYSLTTIKGFESIEYDIIYQETKQKDDSFLEYIEKGNIVLKKVNLEEIGTILTSIPKEDLITFHLNMEELSKTVNIIKDDFGKILEATEWAYLLDIKKALDWLVINLKYLLSNHDEGRYQIINSIANNIFELANKFIELSKTK